MLSYQDIQAIVNQKDLVLRNLQITQSYHELSQGMQRVIGRSNVNWPTFATHASKTAGYAIRQEVMPQAVTEALLKVGGFRETADFWRRCMMAEPADPSACPQNRSSELLTRISRSVSEGNTTVFAELAWPFSQMIETFAKDWQYNEERLEAFLARFRPGPVEEGGQDYLIEAFAAYYQARFTHDRKLKAELVLRANFLVGLHEQFRLQPAIAQALTTPAEMLMKKRLPFFSVLPNATGYWNRLSDISRNLAAGLATSTMMFITVPSGDLALGKDVRIPAGKTKFPAALQTLTDFRLRQLVKEYDHGLDTLTGSGASNWARLEDRMSFIVDMFRSYQQNELLFNAPFMPYQAASIQEGQIPAGRL